MPSSKTRKNNSPKKNNNNNNNNNSKNINTDNNNNTGNNNNNNNSHEEDSDYEHEDEDHIGQLPMHENTMAGLTYWYACMYKKLGWMVQAKAKGYDFKIVAYKQAIEHLIKSLEHVKKEYKDHDRKHDIHVMCMNIKYLRSFVMKHL